LYLDSPIVPYGVVISFSVRGTDVGVAAAQPNLLQIYKVYMGLLPSAEVAI